MPSISPLAVAHSAQNAQTGPLELSASGTHIHPLSVLLSVTSLRTLQGHFPIPSAYSSWVDLSFVSPEYLMHMLDFAITHFLEIFKLVTCFFLSRQ